MSAAGPSFTTTLQQSVRGFFHWGIFWLVISIISAALFFWDGLTALTDAWQLPEYSHGPLIPVLSGFLFLRQLKEHPVKQGPIDTRWPGVVLMIISLLFATLGHLSNINDLVAYALILWVGSLLLISFGWKTGKHFWPPVLHLVYMLPLPGVLYYKMSTWLQFVSSELGVYFLRLLSVPVFLDGNIIDLGVTKLHVAEACSGLRYLFPILSFSYIFAVLYRGPMWHKAVLLISAAPITVFMNSVRIAAAGYIANIYGVEWLDGFTHFFEGWVIFIACIIILFLLARIMLFLNPTRMSLAQALDLDTDGLWDQAKRIQFIQPSAALISSALLVVAAVASLQLLPDRQNAMIERDPFTFFPREIGSWQQAGPADILDANVARTLGADDYHSITLQNSNAAGQVGLFMAWYQDQSQGGVHSPEICLPSSGWEIAWLERANVQDMLDWPTDFNINRAIIQKGEVRMMVYYWFDQKGRKVAWDFAAKYYLMVDGIRTGRTDGALVRLTTMIGRDETEADADARLTDVMVEMLDDLPRFIPTE